MNPRHLSLSNEHYTPAEVVEAARALMGGIDLDPASSEAGAAHVRPRAFFDLADNGFEREWWGNVFLNPPGGKCDERGVPLFQDRERLGNGWFRVTDETRAKPHSAAVMWWRKLASEYGRRVRQAVFVGFSLEILQKAQDDKGPSPLDFPFCVPSRRLSYLRHVGGRFVEGSQPPHASVIVFLPPATGEPPNDSEHGIRSRALRERFATWFDFGQCVAP